MSTSAEPALDMVAKQVLLLKEHGPMLAKLLRQQAHLLEQIAIGLDSGKPAALILLPSAYQIPPMIENTLDWATELWLSDRVVNSKIAGPYDTASTFTMSKREHELFPGTAIINSYLKELREMEVPGKRKIVRRIITRQTISKLAELHHTQLEGGEPHASAEK